MDIVRSFKRNIVENKNLIFISIIITFLIRFYFFFNSEGDILWTSKESYFWTEKIGLLFSNKLISFVCSYIITILITLYTAFINTKHKLIRSRSFLIYLFLPLLLSSHPIFTFFNPVYIALIIFIFCIDVLFSSYQNPHSSLSSYTIGFAIGIGSLFSLNIILYIPLFLLGFKYMRNFSFKAFVSFIFGVLMIYWIFLFYFLWKNSLDEFIEPFTQIYSDMKSYTLQISFNIILFIGTSVLILVILIMNYISNSYHDKIQVRANISFIFIASAFSFIAYIFLIKNNILDLYVFIFSYSILLSHFFSLAEQKWKVYLFYIFISLYFIMAAYFMTDKVIAGTLTV